MAGELVDDPMEITAQAYEMDVGDPRVEGNESQQLEEMVILEAPVADGVKNFLSRKEVVEELDEDYDLTVNNPAVCIDYLSCSYHSLAFVKRIDFILRHCPPLRQEAMIELIHQLKLETFNISRYSALFKDLDEQITIDGGLKNNLTKPVFDSKWVEEKGAISQQRLDTLQAEYKRQKDEGVKESTRRAMEDLFQHYCNVGQVDEALKLYGRGIRDYCTQLKHSINMWMKWIELAIYASEWMKVDNLSLQALRTLRDAEDADKSNAPRNDYATFMLERESTVQANTIQNNRNLIDSAMAKILAVQAIVKLRNKEYKETARKILEIKLDHLQPQWFVTQSDLGIYSLLCSMTSFTRNELKKKVVEDDSFRRMLESEPQFFELLQSYCTNHFGKCFELMAALEDRLLLDPFISRCVPDLYMKIKQKCVVQYLVPHSAIRISTISEDLGFPANEVEKIAVELIERKEVDFRIDQISGFLRIVNKTDQEATRKRVLQVCEKSIYKTKVILWKSVLAQGNIISNYDKEARGKRKTTKHADSATKDFKGVQTFEVRPHPLDYVDVEEGTDNAEADLVVDEPLI